MVKDSINVLFTSAGRRVELLRAFRRAYDSLGLEGAITAVDIDPLAPALRVADRSRLVPRLADPGYGDSIVTLCREHRVHLIFPLIDPDIPVLARLAPRLASLEANVGTVPLDHVETVGDKWQTVQCFARLGLPTPRSWLPGQLDPGAAAYPLFVKPRRGSASQNGHTIRSSSELRFFQEYVPEAMIQEFLPGPEITSDVICDHNGDLLGVVSRRRIEVRSGEVSKGVTCFDPAVVEACRAIVRELQPRGPITVQGLVKDGVVHYTEVNARFGGGIPLAIAAGADIPRWLLARAANIPVDIPEIGTYDTDVHLTRFDESFFLRRLIDGTLQSDHS